MLPWWQLPRWGLQQCITLRDAGFDDDLARYAAGQQQVVRFRMKE